MALPGEYIKLIEAFLAGNVNVVDFEKKYLELFKNDAEAKPENIYFALDKLFSDVDAFCADPDLRDENDIDEDELRYCCRLALGKLRLLSNK